VYQHRQPSTAVAREQLRSEGIATLSIPVPHHTQIRSGGESREKKRRVTEIICDN